MTEHMSEIESSEEHVGAIEASVQSDEPKSAPDDRELSGPFDASEISGIRPYVDLGALKVLPREGLQMRLDVEEASNRIVAVSFDLAESTLQVQAFSAPKSAGVWLSIVRQISAQLEQQGAVPSQQDGVFGPEVSVASVAGGITQMRFIGVDGPRWVLRGTITGKALSEEAARAGVEDLFRSLVVVRGDLPMPPRELLPLRVPAAANVQREA